MSNTVITELKIPTPTMPGLKGTIHFGGDGYLYVCVADDRWLRVQLTSW